MRLGAYLIFGTLAAALVSYYSFASTTFTSPSILTPVVLTDGSTIAVTAPLDKCATYTLTIAGAAHTVANPTGLLAGQCLNFIITQNGTGGFTPLWDTEYTFPYGAAQINSAANTVSVVSCVSVSSMVIVCIGPPLATTVNNFFTTNSNTSLATSNNLRTQTAGRLQDTVGSFRAQLLKSLH